jgi:DNA polymerase III epsilon subunit-like protein
MKQPHVLVVDFETSGLDARRHQGIAVGAIVLSGDFRRTVDSFYLEAAFDEARFDWTPEAQMVHGLTREHLARQPSLKEAATRFCMWVSQHFDPADRIELVSCHPRLARRFLRQWEREAGMELNIHHRMLDIYSCGRVLFGCRDSEQVYASLGIDRAARKNALDDARHHAQVIQICAGVRRPVRAA